MWTKAFVFLLMILIIYNLFRGLFFLVKGHPEDNKKVVRALTYRVALSACLLLLLVFAGLMGWVEPHSVNPTTNVDSPLVDSESTSP